ncbi:MAG: hypothetical protein ABH882_07015 [Candidatus Omnitrophota bacterium]
MTEEKGLININDTQSVIKFLQAPTIKVAEALTGMLASDKNELKLSAGRLVQASIKHKFLTQLGEEIKKYQEKGKIKEDYFATHKEQASLCELLKFIDEEIPDEERFKAIKSIFLFSISKDTIEEDKVLAYELLKICKKLRSGDLLVLKAAYEIVNGETNIKLSESVSEFHSAAEWFNVISKQIGHNLPSLVEVYENNLTDLKLISDRKHPDRSGIFKTPYFRLTNLGFKLCEFITKYP